MNSAENSQARIEDRYERLFREVRRYPLPVIASTLVFLLLGVAYLVFGTRWYRAEVQLLPERSDPTAGLTSKLGGIAGMLGINIGGANSNEEEAIAILKSRSLASGFIEDEQLMTVLLADRWDAAAGHWKGSEARWPDIRDAVKLFDEDVRRVVEDKKTGVITLAVQWTDPELAARWATLLVERLNRAMRERAIQEGEDNVRYLKSQISAGDVVPLQQSAATLLEMELQKLMVARGKEQYAFRVVDAAQVPKKPFRPQKAVVLVLGTLLGICVGLSLSYRRMRRGDAR